MLICCVVEKLYFLKKENDDNHSISFINLALRETDLSASDVLLSRAETKSDGQRLTLPYISLATTPCGLAPPLGRAEVRINLTFTQTSRQQIVCWTSRGSRDRKRNKTPFVQAHFPSACKCLGMRGGGERKVEAIAI
ncbi:hypothetical protein AMECASPLE_026810 [Ameca splendens]|uniref:Uncharacterized protein n=1 Tax=Ameca splendens TaxID=208324 RepID=A0ABV0YG67_9TELE